MQRQQHRQRQKQIPCGDDKQEKQRQQQPHGNNSCNCNGSCNSNDKDKSKNWRRGVYFAARIVTPTFARSGALRMGHPGGWGCCKAGNSNCKQQIPLGDDKQEQQRQL
ncbi:MAG TPA: hypothetical protein VIX90_04280 [Edaphobacter sp.]